MRKTHPTFRLTATATAAAVLACLAARLET